MNEETLLNEYKLNGFLLLKNCLNQDEIFKILRDCKNIFLKQFIYKKYIDYINIEDLDTHLFDALLIKLFEEDFSTFSNCGKQVQHLISLHKLGVSDVFLKVLKQIGLKTPTISTRPVVFFNHPKLAKEKVFYKVDSHQDWRSMQGSLNSVVIWVPLMTITKNIGALEILPKSHKLGLITDAIDHGFGIVNLSDTQKSNLISVEVEPGDILIFSSFLVHQSGENISNTPRWSCHFRFNDLSEETFIQRGFAHPYIYKPDDKLITPNFPTITQVKTTFE
jgi:phytanoyl-CoA hydroxylase